MPPSPEQRSDALGAVVEDAPQVALDERQRRCPEQAERQRPAHGVAHQRRARIAWVRGELVRVVPQAVGAAELGVDEADAWFPRLDARQPAHRHTVQLQAVGDQGPDLHRDRLGGDHTKAQPRRRDRLEIARGRKEVEDLLRRTWKRLLTCQQMRAHAGSTNAVRGWIATIDGFGYRKDSSCTPPTDGRSSKGAHICLTPLRASPWRSRARRSPSKPARWPSRPPVP